jgi:hypothetical protein
MGKEFFFFTEKILFHDAITNKLYIIIYFKSLNL